MLINGCPHAINLVMADGSVETIPPSELLIRVACSTELLYVSRGIQYFKKNFGTVEMFLNGEKISHLPCEWGDMVEVIVSGLALEALKKEGNKECQWLAPGELVRNEAGAVIGCRGFTT